MEDPMVKRYVLFLITKNIYLSFHRIDMKKVDEIIDNTPYISDVRKNFYKIILSKSYEMILKPAYELLKENKFLLEK